MPTKGKSKPQSKPKYVTEERVRELIKELAAEKWHTHNNSSWQVTYYPSNAAVPQPTFYTWSYCASCGVWYTGYHQCPNANPLVILS